MVALGGRKLIYHVQTRRLLERYSGHRITQRSQPLSWDEFHKLINLLETQAQGQQGPSVQRSLLVLLKHWHPSYGSAPDSATFRAPAAAAEVLYHLGSSTTSDTALLQGQRAADALRCLLAADVVHKLGTTVVPAVPAQQQREEEEEEEEEGEE